MKQMAGALGRSLHKSFSSHPTPKPVAGTQVNGGSVLTAKFLLHVCVAC